MPTKNIVTNTVRLSLISDPVCLLTDSLSFIDDLVDTAVYSSKVGVGCVGLAAPQIGILKRAVVVFHANKWIVMINPVITDAYAGRTSAKEMCLSRPGIKSFRKRSKKVKITYFDIDKNEQKITLSRLSARIAQHEIDHLDGKFI